MEEKATHLTYVKNTYNKMRNNFWTILIRGLVYLTAAIFLLILLLFIYLNALQLHYYIDEKFHIPQTLKYCKGKLFEWDPKITTLPGLYLFAALIFGPTNLCTITYLRFINVCCTYVNFILISELVSYVSEKRKNVPEKDLRIHKLYLTAWNITFFPPLFFWFFLYYTDTFSVSLTLFMLLLHMRNKNKTAALMGAFSICVRQTNVIWVTFVCIERVLTLIEEITKKPYLTDTLNPLPCIKVLFTIFKAQVRLGIAPFLRFMKLIFMPIIPYLLVLVSFVIFVIYNGGVVVGDRTAHVPTIHLTQVFYFSVFTLGFSWPYLLPHFIKFLVFMRKHPILSIGFICFITLTVHFNTLVHPYILADNRHYTFYIWKNFMNRYEYFKYLMIPVYAFAIFAILQSLNHFRLLSIVAYISCVCIVLVPQLLLEPRYFIIPYILFRLHQKEPEKWQIVSETFTTIFINIAQFSLFIYKSFYWDDEKYPQRISW